MMGSHPSLRLWLLVLLLPAFCCPGSAMGSSREGGAWPYEWPVELENVRAQATTFEWDRFPGDALYQIPFESREQLEAMWPAILRLKSRGGTLTLRQVGSKEESWPGVSNEKPAVRIYSPSGEFAIAPEVWDWENARTAPPTPEEAQALAEEGKALRVGEPWPKSAYLPNGDLAEYVISETVDGRMTWAAAKPGDENRRVLYRARVDIELIVDGEIINLNRIHLPPDTRIIDKRGLAGSDSWLAAAPTPTVRNTGPLPTVRPNMRVHLASSRSV